MTSNGERYQCASHLHGRACNNTIVGYPMSADGPKAAPDDWDFYFCNVNDVLSSIMVSLSAIRRAPENSEN
jgi:hypothetical protein